MDKEGKFLQDLATLMQIAKTNGNRITKEEIKEYFADLCPEESQRALIYRYMVDNGITIPGYEIWDEPISEEEYQEEDEVESAIVSIYMEELKDKNGLSEEQEPLVARKMLAGDEEARALLIESNLNLVTEIAKEYKKKKLSMGDLIQEGNIGLLMGAAEYDLSTGVSFHSYICDSIRKAIEEALKEDIKETASAKKVANQANELSDLAEEMAQELEREATPKELADRLGITEDQVREIMKISLDAINVVEPSRG